MKPLVWAEVLYLGLLRLGLLVSVLSWILDVPGRLGIALYTEQFLSVVAGCASGLVLLLAGRDNKTGSTPLYKSTGWVLSIISVSTFGYIATQYPVLQLTLVDANFFSITLAIIILACILEATRRRSGLALPVLLLTLIGFALWIGPNLPAEFKTRPVTFPRLSIYLALDTNALFSSILYIASVVVTPFILFGGLLNAFGGGHLFSVLADRAVGRFRGGPAKASIVGSASFGMISGSAVANVVTTGSVSIPLMSRAGFGPKLAGAIESVASTGGQLMPPILGAAAFLMAEFLELPYRDIALAAVLPAFFFYCVLFLAVDLEARRFELSPQAVLETKKRLESSRSEKIGWRWFYLLPVLYLLYLLFWEKKPAETAGVMATAALLVVYLAVPGVRFADRILRGAKAMLHAMDGVAEIVMLSAAAGLIIGVLNLSGISFAITMQIFALSDGSLFLLLVLCALLSILLGMGLPTVGVYILLATLVTPAMTQLGVPALAAHFFVMYFGMLSMITPPVAIASFAAASIAGTSPWATSLTSLRLGLGLYLVPFLFVLNPILLTWDNPLEMLLPVSLSFVTIAAATFVFGGHPSSLKFRFLWALLSVTAFISVIPDLAPVYFGLLICMVGVSVIVWALWSPRNIKQGSPAFR